MKNIYGYIIGGCFCEVALTEVGAKVAATRAGCDEVGYRSWISNMYIPTQRKVDGRWIEV